MSSNHTRRWMVGLGLAAGATVVVLSSAGSAHAGTSDIGDVLVRQLGDLSNVADGSAGAFAAAFQPSAEEAVPVAPLTAADENLTNGVTALVHELFADPTNRDLAQAVSLQDGALNILGQLQSSQDAISAHTGSLSNLVDELFFAPVNQQWLTASEAVLNADLAFADAITGDTGVDAAQLDLLGAEFQLLGAQLNSIPIIVAGIFFGADAA